MSFEAAIRQFLESFKLPGEAQKIIRILEAWSRQFYAQEPGIFSSADAVYILAISVIMLNTDKHNPAVRPLCNCMRGTGRPDHAAHAILIAGRPAKSMGQSGDCKHISNTVDAKLVGRCFTAMAH